MSWHPNSILTVSTAVIDGDYLPNSSLSVKELDSFVDLRQHIKNKVKYFLERPGYTDAMEDFSHLVIRDLGKKRSFSKEDHQVILESKKENAMTKDELKTHINDLMINFMEEFYQQFQLDPKVACESEMKTRELRLSPEDQPDDECIVVQVTGHKFHMYFNQAPNRNCWDQLDMCVHYL